MTFEKSSGSSRFSLLPHRCSSISPGSSCQNFSFLFSSLILRTVNVGSDYSSTTPDGAGQLVDPITLQNLDHRSFQGGVTSFHCRYRRPPPPLPLPSSPLLILLPESPLNSLLAQSPCATTSLATPPCSYSAREFMRYPGVDGELLMHTPS